MQIIAHRKNTIRSLQETPTDLGVEIDLRSHGSDLILEHEPFKIGERFESWLEYYKHKTLILNVKEEGLEDRILECLNKRGLKDYFFLDMSFPFLIWKSRTGLSRAAVRFSEYESIETALGLAGKVEWVWVDCFSKLPLSKEIYESLRAAKFKICLVSPDLQGRPEDLDVYKAEIQKMNLSLDAVCTKFPDRWK